MKILLVEDEKSQQEVFKSSVKVFNSKYGLNVEYEIADNALGALQKIDGSYDGAIIDLRLGNDEEAGNEIVRQLGDPFTRIPIIFATGYSIDLVIDHPSIIKTYSRGEEGYESDLLLLHEIFNTGLTRIMGGRGIIEKTLSEVFLNNLLPLPQRETWISYGKEDSERTEKALLRYALNHLLQLLEEEGERSFPEQVFPEEVYLCPPVLDRITTGSIVASDDKWFAVLSPACDLVLRRNGDFKTDRILLVEIEREDDIVSKALEGIRKKGKKRDKLRTVFGNNYTVYYHWLPKTSFFDGGFLNFRKLQTLNKDEFSEKFGKPSIQISPPFVKDIVARFSSFYARQGQPEVDSQDSITRYTES